MKDEPHYVETIAEARLLLLIRTSDNDTLLVETHPSSRFSLAVLLLSLAGFGVGLSGCGGGSSDQEGASEVLQMVTVNWIEGMALTYVQAQLVEDSLGANVEVNEVQGGGIAFSSVAEGDADFFNEAWLPTTHRDPWNARTDSLQKLGYTYRGTSVGIAVPTYVDVDSFPDLSGYREALGGTINGIEPGAAINDQIRRTIERYGMSEQFSVTASSGPATWQALKSAVEAREAIAVAAWKPHWKWNVYELRYVNGARTGHNVEIWGEPEDIFTVVDNQFIDAFPRSVVCFLKEFEANDEQFGSLMNAFRNRGDDSKREAARHWIQNHPEDVSEWLRRGRECDASDNPVEALPDDATFSSSSE